jgi:hypothetical protein
MSGFELFPVRERSRLSLLALLRGERWSGAMREREADLVVRRRRVLAERVTARRVPPVAVVCGVAECRESVPVEQVRHVFVHSQECQLSGLCDPASECVIRKVCHSCSLRGVLSSTAANVTPKKGRKNP